MSQDCLCRTIKLIIFTQRDQERAERTYCCQYLIDASLLLTVEACYHHRNVRTCVESGDVVEKIVAMAAALMANKHDRWRHRCCCGGSSGQRLKIPERKWHVGGALSVSRRRSLLL